MQSSSKSQSLLKSFSNASSELSEVELKLVEKSLQNLSLKQKVEKDYVAGSRMICWLRMLETEDKLTYATEIASILNDCASLFKAYPIFIDKQEKEVRRLIFNLIIEEH